MDVVFTAGQYTQVSMILEFLRCATRRRTDPRPRPEGLLNDRPGLEPRCSAAGLRRRCQATREFQRNFGSVTDAARARTRAQSKHDQDRSEGSPMAHPPRRGCGARCLGCIGHGPRHVRAVGRIRQRVGANGEPGSCDGLGTRRRGGTGPFLQPSPLTESQVNSIVAQVGEAHAAPMLFGRQSVLDAKGKAVGTHEHVNLVGVVPQRIGSPNVVDGNGLSGSGQAVVDRSLGLSESATTCC